MVAFRTASYAKPFSLFTFKIQVAKNNMKERRFDTFRTEDVSRYSYLNLRITKMVRPQNIYYTKKINHTYSKNREENKESFSFNEFRIYEFENENNKISKKCQ